MILARLLGPPRARRHRGAPVVAFVGSVVPDQPRFHTLAFSRAGVLFQRNLLSAMRRAGLPADRIFSYLPISSYPREPRLLIPLQTVLLEDGESVTLLPFINVTPLKQIMIGGATVAALIPWAIRHRSRARVVYLYNLTVPPGIIVWLGARLIGARIVVSLNDINIPGQTVPSTAASAFDYAIQRWLIPRLDGHVAVSDAIMEELAPHRTYLRMEGGVAPEVFESTATRSPPDAATFRITAAGSLDRANGIEVILDAFSRIPDARFRLTIAGRGPLEQRVGQAAARDPRITYRGFLSHDAVLDLYRESDILLNIRLTRQLHTKYFFPSKLLEYLASGTPVVSTVTGHVERELGDCAFFLREETPEATARLLTELAALPSLQRLERGRRAREYMLRHKTWDAQAARVVQFIRDVVGWQRGVAAI